MSQDDTSVEVRRERPTNGAARRDGQMPWIQAFRVDDAPAVPPVDLPDELPAPDILASNYTSFGPAVGGDWTALTIALVEDQAVPITVTILVPPEYSVPGGSPIVLTFEPAGGPQETEILHVESAGPGDFSYSVTGPGLTATNGTFSYPVSGAT